MPVVQKTGPDGCLYILDWYDRYHCYQDANRDPDGIDRLKGRLYRVRYKTRRARRFDLAKRATTQLIERLRSPNVYFRDLAQRLLAERDDAADAAEARSSWCSTTAAPRKARMHALWALVGAGPLDAEFHAALLAHDDAGFRAWGVRAAGNIGKVDAGAARQGRRPGRRSGARRAAASRDRGRQDRRRRRRCRVARSAGHSRRRQADPAYRLAKPASAAGTAQPSASWNCVAERAVRSSPAVAALMPRVDRSHSRRPQIPRRSRRW